MPSGFHHSRIKLKLQERFPQTKVLLLGVFPRGATPADPLRQLNVAINERIAREISEFAEVCGLHSVDELVIEVGVLITAMQGLAISGSLSEQPPDEILATLKAHYLSCVERALAEG